MTLVARGDEGPPDAPSGRRIDDPDLDGPRPGSRRRVTRPRHPADRPLIANPFLAVLGMILWYEAIRRVVQARRLDLFFPVLASLAAVAYLFQFHCLDCGATGRLSRWREHACGPSRSGHRWLPRLLSPVAQTVLWFYLMIACAVVGYIVMH